MIEVVSAPADLATWDENAQPFYLEVYGETRPLLDTTYAEVRVSPCGGDDDDSRSTQPAAPLYQYWWTLGHSTEEAQMERIWSKLQDVAAHVYLFFPLSGGWRIKELVATVNYLHPFHEHTSWQAKFASDWKNLIAPTIADAGTLAGVVPNPAFAGASALLGAIAKLQINSVPPEADFAWSAGKITMRHHQYGVMQGVMWSLPKKMFTDLGSRLTGSVALSLIPAESQRQPAPRTGQPTPHCLPLLAHAVVYKPHGADEDIWVPGRREFVELYIEPQLASE